MRACYLLFTPIFCLTQSYALTLPMNPIIPYECESCEGLSHDALNQSWLTQDKPLDDKTAHAQVSRKFQIKATAAELNQGVHFFTEAPNAVIRIASLSPSHPKPALDMIKQGKTIRLEEASRLFSKEESLKDTVFNDDLMIVQLKKELGWGQFVLKSQSGGLNKDDGPFIINVYDKEASKYLHIETDKARYHEGEPLTVRVRLSDEAGNYPIDVLDAKLISPSGEIRPLMFKEAKDGLYEASVGLESNDNPHGENWAIDVHSLSVINNEEISRHGHTSISYAIPSAAIREIKVNPENPFSFDASIEVATSSRYALDAVLFAKNETGTLSPVSMVQSGAWLIKGSNTLTFSFDPDLLKQYKPPYYVGYLHLIDFGQLKAVYEYNQPIDVRDLG